MRQPLRRYDEPELDGAGQLLLTHVEREKGAALELKRTRDMQNIQRSAADLARVFSAQVARSL